MKTKYIVAVGLCWMGLSYGLTAQEQESSESSQERSTKFEKRERGEFRHGPMRHEGAPIPPELIEKYDQDKDGKLNPSEMDEARKEMQESRKEEILKKYDKNGDGKLSDSEEAKMEKDRVEEVKQELIKEYDKNGNGRLDSSEKAQIKEDAKIQKGKFWWYNKPGHHPLKELLN